MANTTFTYKQIDDCLHIDFAGDLTVRSGDEIKSFLAQININSQILEVRINEADELDLSFLQILMAFAKKISGLLGVPSQLSIVANSEQKKMLMNSGFDILLNIK